MFNRYVVLLFILFSLPLLSQEQDDDDDSDFSQPNLNQSIEENLEIGRASCRERV